MPVNLGQLPEGERNVGSSRLGRGLVVASLAVVWAVAGCQSQSDEPSPENRAASSAPPLGESLSPAPERTGLTPASPDQGLTEISPSPEPTSQSPESSPTPTAPQETDPSDPTSTPDPTPSASPSGSPSDADEMRRWCEASEPYDYWDSAELRELCEEQYGN
jgi:hypothetical protein